MHDMQATLVVLVLLFAEVWNSPVKQVIKGELIGNSLL